MENARKGLEISVQCAELVRLLRTDGQNFPLRERLLYRGAAVGLCCRKMAGGDDPKMRREAIDALEEADYIVEMAMHAGYLTPMQGDTFREDCGELLAALKKPGGA
jgi:hypothetical protein